VFYSSGRLHRQATVPSNATSSTSTAPIRSRSRVLSSVRMCSLFFTAELSPRPLPLKSSSNGRTSGQGHAASLAAVCAAVLESRAFELHQGSLAASVTGRAEQCLLNEIIRLLRVRERDRVYEAEVWQLPSRREWHGRIHAVTLPRSRPTNAADRVALRRAMFFSPFRPWPAHVMQLGPIGIGKRSAQLSPRLRDYRNDRRPIGRIH
jgi:hypothetical protein